MRIITATKNEVSIEIIVNEDGTTYDFVDESILLLGDVESNELASIDTAIDAEWMVYESGTNH